MNAAPAICWFRNDLRVADNPALIAAARGGRPVIALYVYEEGADGPRLPGAAQRWMLHHALAALADRLERLGTPLVLRRGDPATVLGEVRAATGAGSVFWNRRHIPAAVGIDRAIKAALRRDGLEVESFLANHLHEPSALAPAGGGWYRVFTPFRRALERMGEPRRPLPPPQSLAPPPRPADSLSLDELELLPAGPDWAGRLRESWPAGEAGAEALLERFVDEGLDGYGEGRDFPARAHVSRLSPYLRFGMLSPYQAWHGPDAADAAAGDIDKFRAELLWREFCHHLAFHFDGLDRRNFNARFDAFPWAAGDDGDLAAWRAGRTGYPVVDAGMRELWLTGAMHNRVRMIAASFLTKHLLIDWRAGESWFWDTLVDGDPASNPANWQWVAGCGADAAPYFRIFNPVLQGRRFDPGGAYVRRFVPELAALPDRHVHAPWEAPEPVLEKAGIRLGDTYPRPMVDHALARRRALEAFAGSRS